MSHGGKGSAARPFSVSQQEYETRWDAIFSRDGLDDNKNESLLDNVKAPDKVGDKETN